MLAVETFHFILIDVLCGCVCNLYVFFQEFKDLEI